MARVQRRILLVWLAVLLPAAACHSPALLDAPGPSAPAAPPEAVRAAEVLAPAVGRLDVIRVFASVPTGVPERGCRPVAGCDGGSWELCANPGGFDATFADCVRGGEVLGGSLRATGSGVAGTVAFDLSVDERRYDGFVTFAHQDDCIFQTLRDFTVGDAGLTGELTYCPGTPYPTGHLVLAGADPGTADVAVTFDGTPVIEARFPSGEDATTACAADLATGEIACPPERDR